MPNPENCECTTVAESVVLVTVVLSTKCGNVKYAMIVVDLWLGAHVARNGIEAVVSSTVHVCVLKFIAG